MHLHLGGSSSFSTAGADSNLGGSHHLEHGDFEDESGVRPDDLAGALFAVGVARGNFKPLWTQVATAPKIKGRKSIRGRGNALFRGGVAAALGLAWLREVAASVDGMRRSCRRGPTNAKIHEQKKSIYSRKESNEVRAHHGRRSLATVAFFLIF